MVHHDKELILYGVHSWSLNINLDISSPLVYDLYFYFES